MAVHQTARFLVNPMQSHEFAIMRIGHILATTVNVASPTKLIKPKALKYMLMQTLLDVGVQQMQIMQTMCFCRLVLLYVMQTVL